MRLSIKYLQNKKEVSLKTPRAAWRIVEHEAIGWFPWPKRYKTKQDARKAINKISLDGFPE
jgi:hypothetical protein